MDDSLINPVLLSSSAHLENVEQLIKNIEKQTLNTEQFENISNKPFSSISSNTVSIANHHHHHHHPFLKSITLPDGTTITGFHHESVSIDSLLTQHDSFDNDEYKKQSISQTHDQCLFPEQDGGGGGYTWDDQYDARANYRLTFGTDKSQHIDVKADKSRRHKHRSTGQKSTSTFSDDDVSSNITNNMNDWSMRSSSTTFEQSINQTQQIPSPSTPPSSSSQQQQQQVPNNHSSGSSTGSSSTSWRQMKESQRTTTGIETKETRPPSPLSLYKIFQHKSNVTTSSPARSPFSLLHRQQKDSFVRNRIHETTTTTTEHSKTSSPSHLSTDQAIQTSILLDSSSDTRYRTTSVTTKSDSFNHLSQPTSTLICKSLPDLSFISQYSKELPRSHTTSPSSSSINITRVTPSPALIQHVKADVDRPRTLKSIKRYKNNKHSTEPLSMFYSPQLRKTFAAVPIRTHSNISSVGTKLKFSPFASFTQTSNLKSCLKHGSRATSCDIQDMIEDRTSPISIPKPASNKDLTFSSFKHRTSDADKLKHLDTLWSTKICSNKLSTYILPDASRGHYSEHDLLSLLQDDSLTQKSVSYSESISSQRLSPCDPTIAFNDPRPSASYESNPRVAKRTTIRYRDKRRCQTDIIVVDPILHLHSFTDSPPNEFSLQRDDEDILMDKSFINIIPNLDEPVPIIKVVPTSSLNQTEFVSIEKENQLSTSMNLSTFDNIVETINHIVKRLFEIKQSNKTFFLDNEQNLQLDCLLKDDLCSAIQTILEHGRKDLKKISLWKIIVSSVEESTPTSGLVPRVYYEAKQIAQNSASYWLYKFQAFIFVLLNKNELINWLYYFTRQKDIIQRYYQSPDALILVSISSTFNLFERIMTQLEKLTPLAFHLTYHPPNLSTVNDDSLNTSIINTQPTKTIARDWMMTISRRTSRNVTQPMVQNHANDTFRSTISRKLNAFFSKTNTPPSPAPSPQAIKSSTVVTTKLSDSKKQTKSPGPARRPRFSSVFTNSTAMMTSNTPSPKLKNSVRQSPSQSIGTNITYQSKIPRPSLNVDKARSARYCSTVAGSLSK